MFREMRRKTQALSLEDSVAILNRGASGVLAVSGDDDYPYAVPLSYVYQDSKIYFHCAGTGHKLDAIQRNNKVSFCVIDLDHIVPEEYTTYFRSVIVFGKARILEDEAERRHALEVLAEKYSPEDEQGRVKEIEKSFKQVCIVEIEIEHMTGKEAIELVRMKQK
jgi:nitroimidazol reductase NimA-like FMN-containing flavoprotein (pyridoxamine 5'-phosphate oxidase superfamily)